MDGLAIMQVCEALGISESVAQELLCLEPDPNIVIEISQASRGLSQCKCALIGQRFNRLEKGQNNDGSNRK